MRGRTPRDAKGQISVAPGPARRATRLGFYFDPGRHDFNAKIFLGHTITGSGIAEGEQAMDILARSPATARHISYELARYFVADDPPGGLVDRRVASSYLRSDGDIRADRERYSPRAGILGSKILRKQSSKHRTSSWSARCAPRPLRRAQLPSADGRADATSASPSTLTTPDGYKRHAGSLAQSRRNDAPAELRYRSGQLVIYRWSRPIAFRFDDAGDETGARAQMSRRRGGGGSRHSGGLLAPAPDPDQLAETLGNRFSQSTVTAVREAPVATALVTYPRRVPNLCGVED